MATIEIKFVFCSGDDIETEKTDFDVTVDLQSDVDGYADDRIDELNDDEDADFDCDDKEVSCFDDDYADPNDFSDLDDYGLYVELCDEHGEAFKLRWDDIGEIDGDDFRNSYRGCWKDAEEFAQNEVEELGDCNIPHYIHVDWERTARDIMMDNSEYIGDEGLHIFSDH